MKVIPIGDRIVLKRMEAEGRTTGGILLPNAAQERPQQGRVLSVGDGRLMPDGRRHKCQVQEGDRVIFSQWAGSEIKVDGDELLVMREDDVLAIIE